MKKIYVFGIVSLLALSLLLAGCGGASKSNNSSTDKQTTNHGDMQNMDHSQMNTNGQKSDNKQ